MAKPILVGRTGVYRGVPPIEQQAAPVHNPPPGSRLRFRFRNNDWVRCFVKTSKGITHYIPEFIDGKWHLSKEFCQGVNLRKVA